MGLYIIKMGLYIYNGASKPEGTGELQMLDMGFSWKVKKYSELTSRIAINSSKFVVSGFSYYLVLYKNVDLSISLHQEYLSVELVQLRCKVGIMDKHGYERFVQIKDIMLKGKDTQTILQVKTNDFEIGKEDFLPNNTLTIICNVSVLNRGEKVPLPIETITCLEILSSDLWKLYENQTACDVVLQVDNVKYHAHRLFLSARSRVFAAMFHHDTKESREEPVDIKNVEGPILVNLLYYIYTGKIRDLTPETAPKLFIAADKYGLEQLRSICLRYLQSNLTLENACDVFVLAKEYGNELLQKSTEKFITKNISIILKTEHWKKFAENHAEIVNEILATIILKGQK